MGGVGEKEKLPEAPPRTDCRVKSAPQMPFMHTVGVLATLLTLIYT